MGHNPDELSFRNAVRYNEHSEDIIEHRAAIISKGIGDAFGDQ